MISVVAEELIELFFQSWQGLLGPLRVPGRVLDPDQDAHFVGHLQVAFGWHPKAEFHEIKTEVFDGLQFLAPVLRVQARSEAWRSIAPVQDAAHDEGFAVEDQRRAFVPDLSKGRLGLDPVDPGGRLKVWRMVWRIFLDADFDIVTMGLIDIPSDRIGHLEGSFEDQSAVSSEFLDLRFAQFDAVVVPSGCTRLSESIVQANAVRFGWIDEGTQGGGVQAADWDFVVQRSAW